LERHVRVEIWSDVVCPWCYLGKRRFEKAMASFPHPVEVVYRSFELDPSAPTSGGHRTVDWLARRYGGPDHVAAMQSHVRDLGLAEGLDLRLEETFYVKTVDAHRLLHLALDQGGPELQARLNESLMAANFTEVRDLSDHAVLRQVALDAGLEPHAVDDVLRTDRYRDAVRADVDQASAYGATGVPFFVLEGAYAVSGAQSTEVFGQVLTQVWDATRPAPVEVLEGGDVCAPEGCD
jgi:predicted DsbA family dithiol-disulfide isomerase